jgi:hypothetical protein
MRARTFHCKRKPVRPEGRFAVLGAHTFTCWTLLFVTLVLVFAATISIVVAQPNSQLFEAGRFGSQTTPTPEGHRRATPSKPIPRGWIIAGAGVALLAGCGLLFASIRAWRTSNLFDREYHLPPAGTAAMRFGGTRNGGLMATINFRESDVKNN